MRKIASVALALTLLGTLAGCGKSANVTAPATNSNSGTVTQSEASQVAQQSAVMGHTYFQQAKSLLAMATGHTARPARVRPYEDLGTAADSTSLTWTLQGYDINGNPIDWITQKDQLASLMMDYHSYYRMTGDSLMAEQDVTSHSRIAGLEAAATRYVLNATNAMSLAHNGYSAGYHLISSWAGTSTTTNVAWEKSGTPAYPVAGTITQHWHFTYEYWYGAQHGTGDITTDATITFNGTRYASLQVGTYTFSLDLETWTVS